MEPDDTNQHTQRLEKAMTLASKLRSMHPIMLRSLLRAPLYFLMPAAGHTDGELQIPVSQTPPFIMFKNREFDRHEVPLFTSMARFTEYHATQKAPKPYAVACGDGRTILALIARAGQPLVVNPGSDTTKSLFMPAAFIVQLLDGTMFAPLPPFVPPHPKRKPGELARLQPCKPEDLPPALTNLILEYIRDIPEIAAAWYVNELNPEDPNQARLLIVIETKGEADFAEENFSIIVQQFAREHLDCVACKLNRKTPDGKLLIENLQPFYPAPKPPRGTKKLGKKR